MEIGQAYRKLKRTIMNVSRRNFLAASVCGTAGLALPSLAQNAPNSGTAQPEKAVAGAKRIKLGVCSYSFWHFKTDKVTIETVIEKASAMGFSGVDVLHRQMDIPEKEPLDAAGRAYLRKLKRHAFRNGVSLINLSIHQNFVNPDPKIGPTPEVRQQHIDHTKKCLEIAAELGAPCIRLNSGRWNTIPDFDELMKARGVEPILPGHTEDEGFKWCIDSIEKCLPKAEECGVAMALENHWGLTGTPEGLLRIASAINSPWFGILMDTGNFLENPYDKLVKVAPRTIFVQAKAYYGGGEWYTLDLDYKRIASILADVNYHGYVALEYEGKEDAETAVPKGLATLREAFGV
jgi:sugar phosphate isomerase/epimerase